MRYREGHIKNIPNLNTARVIYEIWHEDKGILRFSYFRNKKSANRFIRKTKWVIKAVKRTNINNNFNPRIEQLEFIK
ncbi:MAG: hypothetical protein M0R03_08680 [Novosphingobium sp.]|nr:hypothetical protein [Novosphingobium sp.]